MGDLAIAVVDLETTGLDHHIHEIVEAAVVIPDGEDRQAWTRQRWIVRPARLEYANPRALKINGYHDRLAEANNKVEPAEMLDQLLPLIAGRAIVGSNPTFDVSFLAAACWATGREQTWRRVIDLGAVAFGSLGLRGLPSLKTLCSMAEVRVPEEQRHTALGDAWAAALVWEWLREGIAQRERQRGC